MPSKYRMKYYPRMLGGEDAECHIEEEKIVPGETIDQRLHVCYEYDDYNNPTRRYYTLCRTAANIKDALLAFYELIERSHESDEAQVKRDEFEEQMARRMQHFIDNQVDFTPDQMEVIDKHFWELG